MKLYKALPVLSVLMAFVLSISCVSALGLPAADTVTVTHALATNTENAFEGTRLVSVTENEKAEATYDMAAVERVISLNRVFGSELYNDDAVVESAQSVINTQSADEVADFVYALYGREVEVDCCAQPCQYEDMTHDVLSVRDANGLLIVTSTVSLGEDSFTAVTTLAPCQNEYGYMIVSAVMV